MGLLVAPMGTAELPFCVGHVGGGLTASVGQLGLQGLSVTLQPPASVSPEQWC